MKLYEAAKIIRSKNADPYTITLDILFEDRRSYLKAKKSGIFTKQRISQLYKIPREYVLKIVFYDPALAIKISMLRRTPAGSPGCKDVYGAQQHAPLLELEI